MPAAVEGLLPADPWLRQIVIEVRDLLATIHPLSLRLLGDTTVSGCLPPPGAASQEEGVDALARLAVRLDSPPVAVIGDDEEDRLALRAALRRAAPQPGPRVPAGAVLLERHILAVLPDLDLDPAARGEELCLLAEAGPAFLLASREGVLGSTMAGVEVDLGACQRLPSLLDLVAAAASAARLPRLLRTRLEAALGPLLMAAAEDAGWLVREAAPAADPSAHVDALDPRYLGFAASLEELEREAEHLLADEIIGHSMDSAVEVAGERPVVMVEPTLESLEAAWRSVAAEEGGWCEAPEMQVRIEEAPAWLGPLLPSLALASTGFAAGWPLRVIKGPPGLAPGDPVERVRRLYLTDFLPLAYQRVRPRLARLLLPCGELAASWPLYARTTNPRLAALTDAAERSLEVRWRAALTLVACAFLQGRMDPDHAADMIVLETGMPRETARAQALHVASMPGAALAWVAGRRALGFALEGGGASERALVLAAGPLPAAALSPTGR
ncbi:MAG: hypothetical protein ACYDGR_14325 [Candidatus Dormibacteria bacterium]